MAGKYNMICVLCYNSPMKKTLLFFIAIIIGCVFWYMETDKSPSVDQTIATYTNSNLGISFSYPKILKASTTPNLVSIHHEVPFTHHDYCDFKSELDVTIDTLTDFHVTFHVVNKNLIDTMKAESPYIPEENFVNNEVIPSPGFIDKINITGLVGFQIFEGAEGCGRTVYYIKMSDKKTLVITNDFITVFSGSIDVENKNKAEAVPGVINGEKAEEIFNSILETLKFS